MVRKAFLISFIPAVVASLALAFSVLGNTWCESITFNSSSDQLPSVNYGIWYLQKTVVEDLIGNRIVEVAKCLDYPESMDIDAKWKTARAFSIIAPVIGGFITFFSWLAPCMYYGKDMWKQGGGWLIVVAIFQGFTLFFLGSNACVDNPLVRSMGYDDTCVMDWGTHLSITSVVCWFMAGVAMMFVIPAPTRPKPPPPETQTVTYTQTEEADGTKVIHTSVVKGTYVAATEEQPISLATTV